MLDFGIAASMWPKLLKEDVFLPKEAIGPSLCYFLLSVPQKCPSVRKPASLTISYTGPGIHSVLAPFLHSRWSLLWEILIYSRKYSNHMDTCFFLVLI